MSELRTASEIAGSGDSPLLEKTNKVEEALTPDDLTVHQEMSQALQRARSELDALDARLRQAEESGPKATAEVAEIDRERGDKLTEIEQIKEKLAQVNEKISESQAAEQESHKAADSYKNAKAEFTAYTIELEQLEGQVDNELVVEKRRAMVERINEIDRLRRQLSEDIRKYENDFSGGDRHRISADRELQDWRAELARFDDRLFAAEAAGDSSAIDELDRERQPIIDAINQRLGRVEQAPPTAPENIEPVKAEVLIEPSSSPVSKAERRRGLREFFQGLFGRPAEGSLDKATMDSEEISQKRSQLEMIKHNQVLFGYVSREYEELDRLEEIASQRIDEVDAQLEEIEKSLAGAELDDNQRKAMEIDLQRLLAEQAEIVTDNRKLFDQRSALNEQFDSKEAVDELIASGEKQRIVLEQELGIGANEKKTWLANMSENIRQKARDLLSRFNISPETPGLWGEIARRVRNQEREAGDMAEQQDREKTDLNKQQNNERRSWLKGAMKRPASARSAALMASLVAAAGLGIATSIALDKKPYVTGPPSPEATSPMVVPGTEKQSAEKAQERQAEINNRFAESLRGTGLESLKAGDYTEYQQLSIIKHVELAKTRVDAEIRFKHILNIAKKMAKMNEIIRDGRQPQVAEMASLEGVNPGTWKELKDRTVEAIIAGDEAEMKAVITAMEYHNIEAAPVIEKLAGYAKKVGSERARRQVALTVKGIVNTAPTLSSGVPQSLTQLI